MTRAKRLGAGGGCHLWTPGWWAAGLLGLGIMAVGWGQEGLELSPRERYWLYLHEGRELDGFGEIGKEAVREERHRKGLEEGFNRKREEVLEAIAGSGVKAEKRGEGRREGAVAGMDWPGLGGNAANTGVATDRGPTRGEVLWQFPVGYDFQGGAIVAGDLVIAPSPGTENVLMAWDRRTGQWRWAARREPVGIGLAPDAGGQAIALGADEWMVPERGLNGYYRSFAIVDGRTGTWRRAVGAWEEEQQFLRPEAPSGALWAYAAEEGRMVAVKDLRTGRMWWKFPTGSLRSEPVMAGKRVFAGTEEGRLWALALEGPERVNWWARAGAALRTAVTVAGGVVYAAAEDGAILAWEEGSGRLLWRTEVATPNPRAQQQFSRLWVEGGRVVAGGADGRIYCLEAATGDLRWKVEAGDWVRARPWGLGNVVVAATLGGEMVAVEETGDGARIRWRRKISEHPLTGDLAGDPGGVLATSNSCWLVALDWRDGREQWRARLLPAREREGESVLADAPPQIHQAPPTVAEGQVFVGGSDGFVHAVEAETGKLRWRYEVNGRVAAAPAVAGDLVLVGEYLGGKEFTALRASTGEPVWKRSIGGVWATPASGAGKIYVGTTEGKFFCLEAADGREVWSWQTGADIYPAPALDGERVYFGSWDGHYYALDRETGELRWAWSPPGFPYHIGGRPDSAAPVLSSGKLVAPILGGRFVALEAATGREIWSWFPPQGICNVTVAADRGVLYLSTFGDTYIQPFGAHLYAVEEETGRTLWDLPGLGGLTSPVITGAGLLICGSLTSPYLEGHRLKPGRRPPELVWRVRTQGNMAESLPAVSGGLGFFLSNDGWLRAIW